MKNKKRIGFCFLIVLLLVQGCAFDFESTIPTIGVQPTVIQPLQGFGPTPMESPEMIELREAVDFLFDPYRGTLPEGLIYEGSVYEKLNIALAEAYRNCGYDLETIAYTSKSNPMTEQKFETCLSKSEIIDPMSLEEFPTTIG